MGGGIVLQICTHTGSDRNTRSMVDVEPLSCS